MNRGSDGMLKPGGVSPRSADDVQFELRSCGTCSQTMDRKYQPRMNTDQHGSDDTGVVSRLFRNNKRGNQRKRERRRTGGIVVTENIVL